MSNVIHTLDNKWLIKATREELSELRLFTVAHNYSAEDIKKEMAKYYIID